MSRNIPTYETRAAIERLVANRGWKAKKVWALIKHLTTFTPDPNEWVSTLRRVIPLLQEEFKAEAMALAADIENLIKHPPKP